MKLNLLTKTIGFCLATILYINVFLLSADNHSFIHGKALSLKSLLKLHKLSSHGCYKPGGIGVNKKHPLWGSASEEFIRLTPAEYTDGVKAMPRSKYSARELSNVFVNQEKCDTINDYNVNALFYTFGQFRDHDFDSAGNIRTIGEAITIPGLPDDPNTKLRNGIPMTRSLYSSKKLTYSTQPVNQVNHVTSYFDCSEVYGSDPVRAKEIRLLKGGLLRYELKNGKEFLPRAAKVNGQYLEGSSENSTIAGDVRQTENIGLSAVHVVFLREHNRIARLLAKRFRLNKRQLCKSKVDEKLYQTARSINCAQIQSITYNEWLPKLLGKHTVKPRKVRYNEDTPVTISNEFATASYRFGHSMVSCEFIRVNEKGKKVEPSLEVKDSFGAYEKLLESKELDYYLRGLSVHHASNLDIKVVDDLRNFLFGRNVAFDLPAFNVQRGRDHGLPDFNKMRKHLGLKPLTATEITDDKSLQEKLIKYFGNDLTDCDPWICMLIEKKKDNSQLGELSTVILKDQFKRFIEGDRCFYSHRKTNIARALFKEINNVRMADIISINTGIKRRDRVLKGSAFDAKPGY
ncbi:hypothetical protein ABK040_002851 [Willaertia magna]